MGELQFYQSQNTVVENGVIKNFSKRYFNGIVDYGAIVPIILPQKLRQKIYLILDMVKLRQVLKLLTVRVSCILVTSN